MINEEYFINWAYIVDRFESDSLLDQHLTVYLIVFKTYFVLVIFLYSYPNEHLFVTL